MTRNRLAVIRRLAVRLVIVLLALTAVGLFAFPQYAGMGIRWFFNVAPPATSPPPTITAAQGTPPAGAVGLQEWLKLRSADTYKKERSSGFLLELPSGEIIGVTTAHSLFVPNPNPPLAGVGLGVNGDDQPVAISDTYFGPPGVPTTATNLAADFVLLKLDSQDQSYALLPDPRGTAQPGERVAVYSGLGDGSGGPFTWTGTVYSVSDEGVFVLMDEATVDPNGMSGSPVISQYTGKVVGMVIAGVIWSRTRWLIGFHPVAHLLTQASAAVEFPKITDFKR